MLRIEQIIFNYGTAQLRRQLAINSKAVFHSHGTDGSSKAASACIDFYTVEFTERASLVRGAAFASKGRFWIRQKLEHPQLFVTYGAACCVVFDTLVLYKGASHGNTFLQEMPRCNLCRG